MRPRTLVTYPHEIFEKIQKARGPKERLVILKEHSSFTLRSLLQINFSPWLKFDLPEGTPPYTEDKNPPQYSASRVERTIKQFAYLVPSNKQSKVKKEVRFIQMLEAVNAEDAKIIAACKDKNLTSLYHKVNRKLVDDVFPNLIKETAPSAR
jgi:hypothetical protein|tara:strand:- start:87 stop:542 length:456 start_codon:yes stop_codon:yes gene_type:complete